MVGDSQEPAVAVAAVADKMTLALVCKRKNLQTDFAEKRSRGDLERTESGN